MPKRKFSRLTNDQKQALRGELDAKIPVTDLAKKYGVSRRTIYNSRTAGRNACRSRAARC